MQKQYYFNQLKKNIDIDKDILESLRFELDKRIYYYGGQFNYPREGMTLHKQSVFAKMRSVLKDIAYSHRYKQPRSAVKEKIFVSNAYFNFNNELAKLGLPVYRPFWDCLVSKEALINEAVYERYKAVVNTLSTADFNDILQKEFINEIAELKKLIKKLFSENKIEAMFVSNDIEFFENITVKACKELNIPTYIFLHGLPGRYNNIDDNRTDNLIVWGEKIKENYVKAGIAKEKIFVAGHPYYKTKNTAKTLRNSFDNVLVITKSMNGSQWSDGVRLSDRGNLILYLYALENALKKQGVKKARLRPHPSENAVWYMKHINKEFYSIDTEPMVDSLKAATLVVGPSSTMFIEALCYGVNYIVFEPSDNNIDIFDFKLVAPFDGTDNKVPVAKNEAELNTMLKDRTLVDLTILDGYIKTPFDISFLDKHK